MYDDLLSVYDKRDDFAFRIVNFPHMDSNIPIYIYISTGEIYLFVDRLQPTFLASQSTRI